MTTDPRAEIRKRIVRRLSNDEWMNKHFGISCHAGDVADAVLELFEQVELEVRTRVGDTTFTGRIEGQPTTTWLVLRTAPEVSA